MNGQEFINQSIHAGITMSATEFFQTSYDEHQVPFDGDTISADCAIADAMEQMGYTDQEIYQALYGYFYGYP